MEGFLLLFVFMDSPISPAQQIADRFGAELIPEFRGETAVLLKDSSKIASLLEFAKTHLLFDMLLDVSSVDHLGSEPRFEVVYHLYSFARKSYLRVKTLVNEEKAVLPTATGVWRGADWHEREVYDMMGIRFEGHPDLRRILMWDSYPHFPLRKEFPLAGIPTRDGHAGAAPMAGGPFVTRPGDMTTLDREPRAKGETDSVV